jgi:hypothetical protein
MGRAVGIVSWTGSPKKGSAPPASVLAEPLRRWSANSHATTCCSTGPATVSNFEPVRLTTVLGLTTVLTTTPVDVGGQGDTQRTIRRIE